MNKIYGMLILLFLMIGCKAKTDKINEASINQDLVDELQRMFELDQIVTNNPFPALSSRNISQEEWPNFQDSVIIANQKRANEILDEYGFVGYDLAGKEGSHNFWIIVQHSDHNPTFQSKVLKKMKIEVDKNNAQSRDYAFLVDQVNINTGKAQIYGTQVWHNMNTGQAYPRTLMDSVNVDKRREVVGLEPIVGYLNEMSKIHFDFNKEFYLRKGITKPFSYNTD